MPRMWESLLAAEQGSGAPVLLVHGQPGSARDWDHLLPFFGARRRVLVVDRPGYGHSAVPAGTMGENAELLADLLQGRGAAPAVVVGHSYGGGVALLMAARRPEAVAGLVLLGSVGAAGSINGFDHLLALPGLGEVLCAAGLFTVGRLLPHLRGVSHRLPLSLDTRLLLRTSLPDRRYAAELSREGIRLWRTFVAEQRSLLAEIADVEAAARHVTVPTVVVTGARDVVVPPSAATELAAALGGQLEILAGVGHFVARDAPRAVVGAVQRVLDRTGIA